MSRLMLITSIFFILLCMILYRVLFYQEPATRQTLSAVTQNTSDTKLPELPKSKTLTNDYHIFQSYNNCGPAALSMTLSYYGISVSQEELGVALRPYQIASGDNDDKSVTLEELAQKAEEYDLIAYHRPNGNPELIKHFINNDIPVITRTWLEDNDDIGHYRIIKGFDETLQEFIQDDSYQGKNLHYSYEKFNRLWEKYNYEYLVLVPKDKQHVAEKILGEDKDKKIAWKNAVQLSQKQLAEDPNNIYAKFNLSVALYHVGDFENSVKEFEQIESQLPFRTLWYQTEPIEAYYKLGSYDRVFTITENILNNQNRAFSELYLLRGEIHKKQGNIEAARNEFANAIFYNENFKDAQNAVNSL